MKSLLGLAALAAFVAWCLTREPGAARRMAGDGDRRPRLPAPPGRHVHSGDPTVRH